MQLSASLKNIMIYFVHESRGFVFVTSNFFQNNLGAGLQEFAKYFFSIQCVVDFVEVQPLSILIVKPNHKETHSNFIYFPHVVYVLNGLQIRRVSPRSVWYFEKRVCVFNIRKQLTVIERICVERADYKNDPLTNNHHVRLHDMWPPYIGESVSGWDLLQRAIREKRVPQRILLSQILHRGYERIVREKYGVIHWIRRYDACDIYFPGVVVFVEGDCNGWLYVCRDGNRRTIKMKKIGLNYGRYYVFCIPR